MVTVKVVVVVSAQWVSRVLAVKVNVAAMADTDLAQALPETVALAKALVVVASSVVAEATVMVEAGMMVAAATAPAEVAADAANACLNRAT